MIVEGIRTVFASFIYHRVSTSDRVYTHQSVSNMMDVGSCHSPSALYQPSFVHEQVYNNVHWNDHCSRSCPHMSQECSCYMYEPCSASREFLSTTV